MVIKMVEENKKLDAKEATKKAAEYLHDIKHIGLDNISIEEIEMTEDKKYWLITLGYVQYTRISIFGPTPIEKKIYKIFKVDANTGEIISMKIRSV
jgi:hypothetical protein